MTLEERLRDTIDRQVGDARADERAWESLQARLDDRSYREAIPPVAHPRQRLAAAVVAFAVFGAAVALALGAFGNGTPSIGPAGAEAVNFSFEAADGNPSGTMQVDGRSVVGNGSSYTWTSNGSSLHADTFGSEFEFKEWTEVPAGAPIEVDGDADEVRGWVDSCCDTSAPPPHIAVLDLTADATMPNEPARYVLEFSAVWPQGDRTFYFPVEVVAQPAASPSAQPEPAATDLVAILDAPDDGTMPGLTFEYGGKRDEYFAQGGHWPGVDAFVLPLLSFSPALAPGTSIVIEGDAMLVGGKLERLDRDSRRTGHVSPLELDQGSGTLPNTPGLYGLTLEGSWKRGSAAFYVVIRIGEPVVTSPSPLPVATHGIVPDVVGIGEGDAYKLLYAADLEGRSTYVPTPGVANGVVASIDPPAGTEVDAESAVTIVVSGTTAFSEGTVSALKCGDEDRMPFVERVGDLPGPPLYFRLNVDGILDTDDVTVGDQEFQSGDAEVWFVVRNGDVIAVLALQEPIEGVACRGSGIGGV